MHNAIVNPAAAIWAVYDGSKLGNSSPAGHSLGKFGNLRCIFG
jgi:hypothetical protein